MKRASEPPRAPGAAPAFIVKSYRDLSADEEEGKFVLITKGRDLHLVLSPISLTPYHANIVYQYLQAEGRGKVEAVSSAGCRILSRSWKMQGGGYYQSQPWLHHLTLHGKSTAFGKYKGELLDPYRDELCGRLGLPGYTLDMK
jgi:hypothetical protein